MGYVLKTVTSESGCITTAVKRQALRRREGGHRLVEGLTSPVPLSLLSQSRNSYSSTLAKSFVILRRMSEQYSS
jgi:hypothetical protein